MKNIVSLFVCAVIAAILSGCGASQAAVDVLRTVERANHAVVDLAVARKNSPQTLRVMSFNVRTKTFIDGPNGWLFRRNALVEKIAAFDPDVLGTQECEVDPAVYIKENLQQYGFVGASRNDGGFGGEMCAIFYKTDRFAKLDEGHFWMSDTPDVPGSRSWGTAFPRMTSWVKLRPIAGGEPFYFFNTHLDHSSGKARKEAAKLLHQNIRLIARNSPVVVTGDFNAGEGSLPYRVLTRPRLSRSEIRLVDSYRALQPEPRKNEGTRHGFRGGLGGERIDWILASPRFQPRAAGIDRTEQNGRYPSDHFPVTAVLRLTRDAAAAAYLPGDRS